MNNSQFAKMIKMTCKEKGISVSKLLDECDIRKSLIYDLEKRNYTPSVAVVEQIADYLECSIDYLLERNGVSNTSIDTYVNGNNNGIQAIKGDVNIGSVRYEDDEEELVKIFRKLPRREQVRMLNIAYDYEEKCKSGK